MALLGESTIGTIVTIQENGSPEPFIVLQHGYPETGNGRTLVIRADIYGNLIWNSSNISKNAYASSQIDSWLNGFYLSLIEAAVCEQIAAVDIPYTIGNGDNTVSTLSRRVFLLSHTELGYGATAYANLEGSAIAFFGDESNRIACLNGEPAIWWTRSPYLRSRSVWIATPTGDASSNTANLYGARPAFTLPSDLTVLEDGTVTTKPQPKVRVVEYGVVREGKACVIDQGISRSASGVYVIENGVAVEGG